MQTTLIRADCRDAQTIWKMQVEAFSDLYEKYQDTDTSPATEPLEKILFRLQQPFTYYYFIQSGNCIVGAIRVVDPKEADTPKRISPIFILKKYRNMEIAQQAIIEAERIHGSSHWQLDTILQETGNCYLYEKMGYKATGKTEKINEKLTLVYYEK